MPSIYPNLKSSDRKYIRTEKSRIRRQFLDVAKQNELISELYKKMVGAKAVVPVVKEAKVEVKKPAAKKAVKPKKVAAK